MLRRLRLSRARQSLARSIPSRRVAPRPPAARLSARLSPVEMLEQRTLLSTISGTKFQDVTGDGFSGDDAPLAGWTIRLYQDDGDNQFDPATDMLADTQVTASDGTYQFSGLAAGTYFVQEEIQPHWVQTGGPSFYAITLPDENTDVTGQDFANFQLITISGTKYEDHNGDGVRDAEDQGLAGWTIYLDGNGNGMLDAGEASTVTDADGNYSFSDVAPGSYAVREQSQAGWMQTTADPAPFAASSGSDVTSVDFGNHIEPIAIAGQKFHDLDGDGRKELGESGLAGWTVYLDANGNGVLDEDEVSTISDETGHYAFAGLEPGVYRVRELPQAGWVQTTANPADLDLIAGQTVMDIDFGNFQTVAIRGQVYDDRAGDGVLDAGDQGLEGWTIFLDTNDNGVLDAGERSTVTDADGSYIFSEVGPGNYFVREIVPAGWVRTSTSPVAVETESGSDLVGINFGNFRLITISGVKFNDLNGDGVRDEGEPVLGGWVLFLDTNGSGELDDDEPSTTTDADGSYSFTGMGPGTYRVREVSQAGWVQTTPLNSIPALSGVDLSGIDIGNFERITIRGTKFEDHNGNGVRDAGDDGLAGWTLLLDANGNGVLDDGELSTVTDADGNYAFADLGPGTYRVREVAQAGWVRTATPADVIATSGVDVSDADLGNFRLITIRGTKFEDQNGDGMPGPEDTGLAGWTLFLDANNNGILDAGERTAVTDSQGRYDFGDVGPGIYRVREMIQAGWMQTTLNPADIEVVSGDDVSGADFGNFRLIFLGGQKFNDVNGNGVQDPLEPGLVGWTIFLDSNDNGLLDAFESVTHTDANGNYTFSDLGPGVYRVREVGQPGWIQTTPAPETVTASSGVNAAGITFGNFQLGIIRGQVFADLDGNGVKGADEPGLAGWTVFFDTNQNGTLDEGELSTVTDALGNYLFPNLAAAVYHVASQAKPGYTRSAPVDEHIMTIALSGTAIGGKDFGSVPPLESSLTGRLVERNDVTIHATTQDLDHLYDYVAFDDGIVTVQLFATSTNGPISLEVRNDAGVLIASSTLSGNTQRVDLLAAKGDHLQIRVFSIHVDASTTYDLKVTNSVRRLGSQLLLAGGGRDRRVGNELFIVGSGRDDQIVMGRNSAGIATGDIRDILLSSGAGAHPAARHDTRYDASIIDRLLGIDPFTGFFIRGRRGDDLIIVDASVTLPATMNGNRGDDTIQSGSGNDLLRGGRGSDVVDGGAGNDRISALITASNPNEDGNDKLSGGAGNDTLTGGAGDDTLDGGTGSDVCQASDGHDTTRNCEALAAAHGERAPSSLLAPSFAPASGGAARSADLDAPAPSAADVDLGPMSWTPSLQALDALLSDPEAMTTPRAEWDSDAVAAVL